MLEPVFSDFCLDQLPEHLAQLNLRRFETSGQHIGIGVTEADVPRIVGFGCMSETSTSFRAPAKGILWRLRRRIACSEKSSGKSSPSSNSPRFAVRAARRKSPEGVAA